MLRPDPLELDQQNCELYLRIVPEHHPLRKMNDVLDFSFILDVLKDRYNQWIGRQAKHPELMWRLLFCQFYMKLSDEKVCLAAQTDLAVRLFLRLGLHEQAPHPSTLAKFRFWRMDLIDYIEIHFRLLEQAERLGLLDRAERQIMDTSHLRSNTRVNSIAGLLLQVREALIKVVKEIDPHYGAELEAAVAADKRAYAEEREQRRKEGKPKLTKEEKAARAVAVSLPGGREELGAATDHDGGGERQAADKASAAQRGPGSAAKGEVCSESGLGGSKMIL
ncbi:MAG: transposase, partial [Chloroflexi bacterium]|nr:transposase [Chloroflexota bacterium]